MLNLCDNVFIFIICIKCYNIKFLLQKEYLYFNDSICYYEIFYYMVFTRYSAGKMWSSICIQGILKAELH